MGPEGFKFELKDENGEKVAQAITNDKGDAKIVLSYTKDDAGKEFKYTLSEVNEGGKGMTYDDTVYEIGVKVSLEANVLSAEITKNGAVTGEITCAFENIYDKDLGEGGKPEGEDGEGEEGEDEPSVDPPTGDKAPLMWLSVCMFAAGVTLLIVTLKRKRFEK